MTAAPSWIAGSSPDCDIRVDSPTVSGRHCQLTQRGDVYLLEDLQSTNGTFVDGQRVTGAQIVRRGEPVTLGHDTPLRWSSVPVSITVGRSPDNDVVIPRDAVSAQHARVQREGDRIFLIDLGSTNGTAINDPTKRISKAPLKASDLVFLGTHRVAAADLLAALPDPAQHHSTVSERVRPSKLAAAAGMSEDEQDIGWPPSMQSPRSWLIGIVLSLVVIAVLFGVPRLFRAEIAQTDDPTTSADSSPAAGSSPDKADDARQSEPPVEIPDESSPPHDDRPDKVDAPDPPPNPLVTDPSDNDSPAPEDPWKQVLDKCRKAVFLLAIEEPNKTATWPAASACAIGESTLLTSGRMVTGLAAAKQQGWTLWAINEPLDLRVKIESLRVHVGFAKSTGHPQEQIFFDLGLVDVAVKLSSFVEPAGPVDLNELEPGLALGCVGVEYEENAPLYRFQSNAAELSRAKVLRIERLGPPPAPSLLVFGANLPSKQYGAILVNREGRACAVFAEFMQTDDDSRPKMHYAPWLDSDAILHASSTSSDLWVEPEVPKENAEP